jgi:hypothetical protein
MARKFRIKPALANPARTVRRFRTNPVQANQVRTVRKFKINPDRGNPRQPKPLFRTARENLKQLKSLYNQGRVNRRVQQPPTKPDRDNKSHPRVAEVQAANLNRSDLLEKLRVFSWEGAGGQKIPGSAYNHYSSALPNNWRLSK